MDKQNKIKSYAKINLFLNVVSKKENGYHYLQMINMKISLYDEITINYSLENEDKITFDTTDLNSEYIDETFLLNVVKKLKEKYQINKYYDIYIKKHIPIGSGLGGGSMNASSIIDYILQLENVVDCIENKISNFKDLGADIAYGFYKGLALVEDEGFKITPLNMIFDKPLVLVSPNIKVNTKKVFENNSYYGVKLSKEELIEKINLDLMENSLEISTFNLYHELKKLKQNLSKYGKVVMSGSGSSMMVYTNEVEKIKQEYPQYLVMKIN